MSLLSNLTAALTGRLLNPRRRGGGFSPLNLAPVAWLDAADPSTITDTNGVEQWLDKSGNGNHATQPVLEDRPITGVTTQNGLNVITAAGSSQYMMVENAPQVFAFYGVTLNSTTSGSEYIIVGSSADVTRELFITGSSVSFDGIDFGVAEGKHSINGAAFSAAASNHTVTNPVGPTYWSGVFTNGAMGLGRVCGRSALTREGTCGFCELLWFNRELTASEKQQLDDYFIARWGIS